MFPILHFHPGKSLSLSKKEKEQGFPSSLLSSKSAKGIWEAFCFLFSLPPTQIPRYHPPFRWGGLHTSLTILRAPLFQNRNYRYASLLKCKKQIINIFWRCIFLLKVIYQSLLKKSYLLNILKYPKNTYCLPLFPPVVSTNIPNLTKSSMSLYDDAKVFPVSSATLYAFTKGFWYK